MTKQNIVQEVQNDFLKRREERKHLEAKWLLNLNFLEGNQYSALNSQLEIVDYGRRYYWEERAVYNHIAPLIEARLAKFTRVNCAVNVRPASGEEDDVQSARLATKLLETTFADNDFYRLFAEANLWAEITGTVFYKVYWSAEKGGQVKLAVCPSYEIYPDNLGESRLQSLGSIIHAKAYPIKQIKDIWGQEVEPEEVSLMLKAPAHYLSNKTSFSGFRTDAVQKEGYAMVIERYEAPTRDYPDGRLIIVSGDKLLYEGTLPYLNGENGTRGYPFVKQVSFNSPCSFYGSSVIERLIPVQRAFNAVKNRKHEFLSRLSVGVLAVEEGSVDLDSLEEEGLAPGKVLTYRQGSTPPLLMSPGTVPQEFRDEEDRLLAEFKLISGVNDNVHTTSNAEATISGYALSLLIEQDYMRLSVTTESIRSAVKEVARHILRLYREFSTGERILKISGDNGEVELKAFRASSLKGDDIVMESDSTMVETPATRKSMVLELLKSGLLGDENGVISNRNRAKIVEMLGFGNWEHSRNDEEVHLRKATLENQELALSKKVSPDELDDHAIHIAEHVNSFVSGKLTLTDSAKRAFKEHVRKHKVLLKLSSTADES